MATIESKKNPAAVSFLKVVTANLPKGETQTAKDTVLIALGQASLDPKVKSRIRAAVDRTTDWLQLQTTLWDLRLYFEGEGVAHVGWRSWKKPVCKGCGQELGECNCYRHVGYRR